VNKNILLLNLLPKIIGINCFFYQILRLIFDSHFECGNLDKVVMISQNEYDLFLNSDTNSKFPNSQWFYFSTTNTKEGQIVRFNIQNCSKNPGLIKAGMTPAVFSTKKQAESFVGWTYPTYDCVFQKNSMQKRTNSYKICLDKRQTSPKNESPRGKKQQISPDSPTLQRTFSNGLGTDTELNRKSKRPFSTYSFSYKYEFNSDKVLFALYKPYPLNRLYTLLSQIQHKLSPPNTHSSNTSNTQTQEQHPLLYDHLRENTNVDGLNYNSEGIFSPLNIAPPANPFQHHFQHIFTKSPSNPNHDSPITHYHQNLPFPFPSLQECFIQNRNLYYANQILCFSEARLPVPVITITNNLTSDEKKAYKKPKKFIVITARVHAAETAGSFIIEAMIKKLALSNEPIYNKLRSLYVFIIVPILNPDGVVLGNYRNSLNGCDLNRCWTNPSHSFHPTVFYLKTYLKKMQVLNK
jgi:hypothetical protein